MEKYINLKGKNVVDNNDNVIGSVEGLFFDEKLLRVNGLIVCNIVFVKNFYIIPLKCLKSYVDTIRFDRTIYRVKKSMLIKNTI